MAVSLSFGQYLEKQSPLHRADTRLKLTVTVAYALALLLCSTWLGLVGLTFILASAYAIAHISPQHAFRGLKPLIWILILTVVFNAITFTANAQSSDSIPSIAFAGGFAVSVPGAATGLFFALRMVLLLAATSLFAYTSPLVDVIKAVESILRPLKKFQVPVEDISVVCAITLRFVPTMIEEAEKITKAQKSRGLLLDNGGVLKRAKAWIPVVIPLFVSLFKRAERLACAMDARCYTGNNRTSLHAHLPRRTDTVVGVTSATALITLGVFC